MNELALKGKRRTILISISLLLLFFYTIFLYHSSVSFSEPKKIVQQGVRFVLTLGLLFQFTSVR